MEQLVLTQLMDMSKQLSAVAKDVGDIKSDGDLLKQNLFGGVREEMPYGRVPKVETTLVNHNDRIIVLENAHIRYKAYGAVIGVISGALSAILTSFIIFLLQSAITKAAH